MFELESCQRRPVEGAPNEECRPSWAFVPQSLKSVGKKLFSAYNTSMGTVSAGVFGTLPASFFSPLASPNREHYAAFLVIFYRTFQETPHGVERSLLVSRFVEYIAAHRGQFEAEEDGESGESDADREPTESVEPARAMASRFLRTLLRTGWLGSEELGDYTRIVNMQSYAKPFFEALARVEEGLKTEYESHVIAVFSLLCGEAVAENGHYAVLNAHASTVALGDSLKVLSQNIKDHYERFDALAVNGNIPDLLHLHYDIYANDILDGAYRRLKTSDNLSRYRPRILKRVGELLADGVWLTSSALKYSRTGRFTAEEARERLETMLGEIRDILRAVDPLLDEIDRRNMLYSRSSIERVKTLLEPESTIAGRIATLAREFSQGRGTWRLLGHHLYQVRLVSPESRYRRWLRESLDLVYRIDREAGKAELERAEAELRLRLARQLGPKKVAAWLDEAGGATRLLGSQELVRDTDSFVRLLYAVLYADARSLRFGYTVADGPSGRVEAAGYDIPDLVFRRIQ